MVELLYSSGMRLAELVSLDVYDLDFQDASLRVTGKGRKERLLPIGRKAMDALERWLACRDKLARPDEMAVFVSQRGRRISARSVQLRLARWGITKAVIAGYTRTVCGTRLPVICWPPVVI